MRIALLRMSCRSISLICTMHHIIGDGQSLEVIIAEMSQLYDGVHCRDSSRH